MMSLGVRKGAVISPSAEDRKKIITQMKVRTTLKGDKSWIQPQNSDNEEEEKRSSPLLSPCRSGKIDGGSPVSASATPHSTRLPSSKPTSGYLIRGVFTRTIDKTPLKSTSYSSGMQKSAAAQAKSASLPHFSSGYKMTTEDYKKLAPFNVRQTSIDSDEEEPSFSPDEHKKRTEAANSVLRRTASKERSYVFSAAKKSNGSPTQEVLPFIAKRVEIEEEGRPRRRSQTLPASSRFSPGDNSTDGVRKSPNGSSWREPKAMAAVSTTSLDTDSKNQANRSWSESTSQIPSSTENSDKVAEEKPAGTSPGEARTPKPTLATGRSQERVINAPKPMPQSEIKLRTTRSPEKSDKPVKEEPDLISWDESIPKATTISTAESEKEEGTLEPRVRVDCHGPIFSEERVNSHYKDSTANTTPEMQHWYRVPEYLDDTNSDLPRSSSRSRDIPAHPTDTRFKAPAYLDDTECDPKRSVPGSEERSTMKETRNGSSRVTEQKEPELNVAKSASGHEERETTRESRNESPRAIEHNELDRNRTKPNSHSRESTVTTPESRSRDPMHVDDTEFDQERSGSPSRDSSIATTETRYAEHNEPDLNMTRIASDYEERISITRETNHESPQTRRHNDPDLTTAKSTSHSRESTFSMTETCHVIPSYLNRQQFNTSMSEPSHEMSSYLDNQAYDTRRPVPGYEERSSPRDTRYESPGASGHNEFDHSMGRHYAHSRDSSTVAMSQGSHSWPCYMDGSESDTRRLPSASSERISMSTASSPYNSPSAPGHEANPNTASKGILFVKEYVNSRELSPTPRYSSSSLVDLSDVDRASYSNTSYLHSSAPQRSCEGVCTYCGREIRDCPKIMIDHLNVYCHEYCFRCGICHKAMGDLLDKIFIHRDIVHCDQCYEKLF